MGLQHRLTAGPSKTVAYSPRVALYATQACSSCTSWETLMLLSWVPPIAARCSLQEKRRSGRDRLLSRLAKRSAGRRERAATRLLKEGGGSSRLAHPMAPAHGGSCCWLHRSRAR